VCGAALRLDMCSFVSCFFALLVGIWATGRGAQRRSASASIHPRLCPQSLFTCVFLRTFGKAPESLTHLKDAASSSLESLQPTLRKLQTVAMDYAPAVLADKLKAEPEVARNKGPRSGVAAKGQRENAATHSCPEEEVLGGGRGLCTDNQATEVEEQTQRRTEGSAGLNEHEIMLSDGYADNERSGVTSSCSHQEAPPGPHVELFAPGRLYHLVYKEKDRKPHREKSVGSPRMYRLIRGRKDARFSRIVLSGSMLQDHASREAYWGMRELLKVIPQGPSCS
jgi:hypothetical protein